jgi:hypothetical protein
MQQKGSILISTGAFLLVLGSTSYGADVPIASDPPTVSDPNRIYLTKENPFFIRHIDKAVKHAGEAEMAGNLGKAPELLQHAQLSLDYAREAQRAGSVPGMNEGLAFLRKALGLPLGAPVQVSPSLTQGVNPQCVTELELQCGEVQPGGGRLEKCFEDKLGNFSPVCQEQLKDAKTGIGAAHEMIDKRHQKELTGSTGAAASVQETTNYVREARKNFSLAGGIKFVDLTPQAAVPTR